MARECFSGPVTLDGPVPTARRNYSCHLVYLTITMTGGVLDFRSGTGKSYLLYDSDPL